MTEIIDMPFSGVECSDIAQYCKVFYAQTIHNKTYTVVVYDLPLLDPKSKLSSEIMWENKLNNTKVAIEGVEV